MKAVSETHFENENMFSEKWKVINPLKKTAIRKKYKKSKMFVSAKFYRLIISNAEFFPFKS